ncbi:MAG: hypothetical protein ACI9OJ_000717 [Myxococcota bacterium]|jgi:hypothetical protein
MPANQRLRTRHVGFLLDVRVAHGVPSNNIIVYRPFRGASALFALRPGWRMMQVAVKVNR